MDAFATARCWRLTRSSAPNPNEFVQRARTFVAGLGGRGYVTLLVRRVGQSIESYVITHGLGSADQTVLHLAHSVGAQATEVVEVDQWPVLNVGAVSALTSRRGQPGRDSQYGNSPTAVAERLSVSLADGQWVGISLRQPTRHEERRVKAWYRHMLANRSPTHHAFEDGAVVMSLAVGGRVGDDLASLGMSVAASLPGFDAPHRLSLKSSRNVQLGMLGGSVAAAIAGFVWGGLVGVFAFSFPFAVGSVWAGTATDRRLAAWESANFDRPKRLSWLARGRKQQSPDSEPTYPMPPGSFLVGPAVCPGLVAPHAGASSGATSTGVQSAPEALTGPIGPIVGVAGDADTPVSISMADAWAGIGICGQPGSGKSQLMRSLFAYSVNDLVRPTGRVGHDGQDQTIVVFESKADGLRDLLAWCDALGAPAAVFDVGDPSSWAFDMLGGPGTIRARVERFVGAMVYAFDDGSIQAQSQSTLTAVLGAALLVTDAIADQAGVGAGRSPIDYAMYLLGGNGDDAGLRLASAIMDAVATTPITEEVLGLLRTLYGPKSTPSQRTSVTQAPRNKMQRLLAARSWWAPNRGRVTTDELLGFPGVTVIYTGPSSAVGGDEIDEITTSVLTSMLMFMLRDSIGRSCAGWREIGRSVTIFADELSLLAKTSPEVVTWLRDQGRSYGVRLVLATQRPEQLSVAVREAFLGLSTFFWFSQGASAVAAAAAADLSAGGENWPADTVVNLAKFQALLRASADQRRQPIVPISISFFEGDRTSFRQRQGLT